MMSRGTIGEIPKSPNHPMPFPHVVQASAKTAKAGEKAKRKIVPDAMTADTKACLGELELELELVRSGTGGRSNHG